METFYFLHLFHIAPFLIGQLGNSCSSPNFVQITIITVLVAASGIAITSTGVGLVGIVSTLIGLITTGASIDAIASALGVHLGVVAGSLDILGGLVVAIRGVLGC